MFFLICKKIIIKQIILKKYSQKNKKMQKNPLSVNKCPSDYSFDYKKEDEEFSF